MVIMKIFSPPAGTVPVHVERVGLGAPDYPPNGILHPLAHLWFFGESCG